MRDGELPTATSRGSAILFGAKACEEGGINISVSDPDNWESSACELDGWVGMTVRLFSLKNGDLVRFRAIAGKRTWYGAFSGAPLLIAGSCEGLEGCTTRTGGAWARNPPRVLTISDLNGDTARAFGFFITSTMS